MTALHRLVVLLVAAFILAPIVVVVAVSLTDSPIPEFPPRGLTLRWYAHALSEDVFTTSALNSLWLATLATAIATPLALAAAYGLVRGRFRGRDAIQTLLLAPLVVPSLVIGLAILLAFSGMGVRDVGARLVGAHVLITFPYMVRTILASLARLDPAVEEAARTLGASALRCFVLVTLPLVRPGVVAGMLFAFIVSFDNVSLSLFLTNARTNTLPIAILNYVEYNFDPSVAAISTMLVAFSLGAALLVERLVGLRRVVGG
ncbi:MAG: ABC transporter permease [Alphaproteobacteria bacterium]|jgi:putative spermidine/putrescine transport system permease protein